jgi:hypothetical protein
MQKFAGEIWKESFIINHMKQAISNQHRGIPNDAVLLIPEPEGEDDLPTCVVKPGFYNSKQMLDLLEKHTNDANAIHYIADMLETGDAENDGFACMLRKNHRDPTAITRIIKLCRH